MDGREMLSTQTIVDYGIKHKYDEDTIVRYLDIEDPKLDAIVRAYIHVRTENNVPPCKHIPSCFWCCY